MKGTTSTPTKTAAKSKAAAKTVKKTTAAKAKAPARPASVTRAVKSPKRLATLQQSGLLDSPTEAAFDRTTALASEILKAPVALISLVDRDRQFFKSQCGLPEPLASERQTPLSHSFCQHVVASGEPLVVPDARKHPVLKSNPAVSESGVISYAGMPLTTSEGHTLGSFCVVGEGPRKWTKKELAILRHLADFALTEIELRIANNKLQDNYKRLQAAEALRNDLTQMLVHDLRTPLSALLSGLSTVREFGDLNLDQNEALEIAIDGGQALAEMVSDLLEVSRMEEHTLQLEIAKVALPELIAEAVQQVKPLYAFKQIMLDIFVMPDLPEIAVDADKVRRTFVNLLGNAVKFTPRRGMVRIMAHLDAQKENLLVVVKDTGRGIPEENQKHIFKKFAIIEDRDTGNKTSTGLGLTFCKLVAEAHGGKIWVESVPDQGSCFWISLPLKPAK